MKAKLIMLFVAVSAMLAVFALDSLRTQFKDSREKPYTAANVASVLAKATPPSDFPGADLARAFVQLRTLRDAASAVDAGARFASPDEAFNAVLAKSSYARDLARAQAVVRNRYSGIIAAKDAEISTELTKAPPPPDAKKEEAANPLEALKKQRAELLAARTSQTTEVELKATTYKTELRHLFDEAGVAENAKTEFKVTDQPALNKFAEHVADPEHPLSIVYDLFWYAAIAIGVLVLVALLLTPVFNAVPVAGTNEKFMDQIRGLFGRAPTRVGMSVARVAAMTIGAAAIVSVATTAPSSPLHESSLMTPSREESQKKTKDEQKQQTDKQNTGTTDTTGTTITDTTGTSSGGDGGTTTSPCTANCSSADPRVDGVLTDIASLKTSDATHNHKLTAHDGTLETHGRKFESYDVTIDAVKTLPSQMAALTEEENEQKQFLTRKFERVDDAIDKAHFKAESAEMRANDVDAQVTHARSEIREEAKSIRDGVELPLKVGERPTILQSVFGFDRYRITQNTVTYVERAVEDAKVVDAVKAMKSDDLLSNDALRRELRERVCGEPKNCDAYLKWRNTVIRAARVQ